MKSKLSLSRRCREANGDLSEPPSRGDQHAADTPMLSWRIQSVSSLVL